MGEEGIGIREEGGGKSVQSTEYRVQRIYRPNAFPLAGEGGRRGTNKNNENL